MLQKTSLLARLSQRPNWNPVVYGCLVETESGDIVPLWPERWPLQELIEDYQEYFEMGLTETWLCEMMNMPGFTKNGFRPDAVYYRPTPLQDERSEEHTSELQSLMRISYAVFCLQKKIYKPKNNKQRTINKYIQE